MLPSWILYSKPEVTKPPPRDEVLLPYSMGGEKKPQPPGNSPLNQSRTRTCIREAFPSSAPGMKYTDSIFNQTPDGGKPEAARLPVACGLAEEEARLPGTASAGVQYNNVKPPTHHQHLIPGAGARAAAGSQEIVFHSGILQAVPSSRAGQPSSPPSSSSGTAWPTEKGARAEHAAAEGIPKKALSQLRLQPANKHRDSLER